MEFFETVKARHSSRAYSDKKVDEDLIQSILQAVNRAPSAGNFQSFEIFVVKDEEVRKALVPICFNQEFIAQAPVSLIFMTNSERSLSTYGEMADSLFSYQDATIACAYAELAVTALGMSACWIGGFKDDELHSLVHAPAEWKTNSILCFGYPADNPEATSRRELSSIYTCI